MIPYWFMLMLPALGLAAHLKSRRLGGAWHIVIIIFVLMIGLRHQVGGDWGNYAHHFYLAKFVSFSMVLSGGDPGYYALNWFAAHYGLSIYFVNFMCASIMMIGVSVFAKAQPFPWLALFVAVPYLLIVVAMGYTRQAAALGLVLLGLTALGNKDTTKFVIWVILAAMFHKSAVVLLPLGALAAAQNRFLTFLWVGITAVAAAYFVVYDSVDVMLASYVESEYAHESQGGQIRVFMNAVPAVLLLIFRRKLFHGEQEKNLWLWMSIFSIVMIPLVGISATAVDRIALYLIPLQIFAFSRMPYLVSDWDSFKLVIMGVLFYYTLVQFVWLNFAVNANSWLPYNNLLFLW